MPILNPNKKDLKALQSTFMLLHGLLYGYMTEVGVIPGFTIWTETPMLYIHSPGTPFEGQAPFRLTYVVVHNLLAALCTIIFWPESCYWPDINRVVDYSLCSSDTGIVVVRRVCVTVSHVVLLLMWSKADHWWGVNEWLTHTVY